MSDTPHIPEEAVEIEARHLWDYTGHDGDWLVAPDSVKEPVRNVARSIVGEIASALRSSLLGKPDDGAQLQIREAAGDTILGCEWYDSVGEPLAPNDPQLECALDEIALVAEAIYRERLLEGEAPKAAELQFMDPLNIGLDKVECWRRVLLAAWEATQKQGTGEGQ